MKKQRWLLLLTVICLLVALIPMAVSADAVDGWFDNGDGTKSYYRDGALVTNAVIELEGEYFAFNDSGIMYDNTEFYLNDFWYRAKEGGTLYVNEWFDNGDAHYYYAEEGKAAADFVQLGDDWYYFHGDGYMAHDAAVYSWEYQAWYALDETGTKYLRLKEGWNSAFGKWYYMVDGNVVSGQVLNLGGVYYGFDYDGQMHDGERFWLEGHEYCAKAGGALYVNSWYYDDREETWYYFAEEGKSARDFLQIGGVWYYFYHDGRMATDAVVYSNEYHCYYAISEDGTKSVALTEGWNAAFGTWYYLYQDGESLTYAASQLREIGGKMYWFDYRGKLVENEAFFCEPLGRMAVATSGGALLQNGWLQLDNDWYYADEYALYEYGVYEINGAYYFFENCRMYDIPGEYDGYYVSASGALYRNAWRYDKTAGYDGEAGWVYYGDDAHRVYGVQTIGNATYCFDPHMCTNEVIDTENGLYIFGADGVGTPADGWFKHPANGDWMYAVDGRRAEGILSLSSGTYAFSDGYMLTEDYYYAYDEATGSHAAYLFDAKGLLVTTPGWHKLGGSWYVVTNNGYLHEGWLKSGSDWYYMTPDMLHDTVFYDYEYNSYYAADNDGSTVALSGSGWRQMRWGRVYLENGKPVIGAWKQLGGAWYYFAENGEALAGDACYVGDKLYLFDQAGKLVSGGWHNIGGSWYYTNADGIPVTGVQTIGGVQYLFNDRGWLYYEGIHYYEGERYWTGEDGRVLAKVQEGWNQVDGKWYYIQAGELLRNCLYNDNGVFYGFDRDGVMCTNGIYEAWYDFYMFDKSGKILTGWQFIDGKWRYADPYSDDPYMYTDGLYWINDKEYCFENGAMVVGTVYKYGRWVTTDANGVVIETKELGDGWTYTGSGYVYLEKGESYIGWVGDYYVHYGDMLYEQSVEYNGEYYYLGADGRYIRNGWYQTFNGEYVYAKANGTLCCNEWLYQGGKYYYFSNVQMARAGVYWIDDEPNEFDEDGVWLGKIDEDDSDYVSMPDGWQKIGGKWYYYHANTRLIGTYYIDGAWYALYGENGAMLSNCLFEGFYYDASGARAAYTGWKKIDGYWIYFDEDYSVHYGWIKSGNGWYYADYEYNEDTGKEYVAMIANKAIVEDSRLYHFGASGYCSGPVEADGWYQVGSDWYYLENSYVVRDAVRKIGGALYYFDYSGKMMTNDAAYVEIDGQYGIKYFGANGAAVNTAGWIQYTLEDYYGRTRNVWLYINKDGFLYTDGIYMIGGVQYTFREGIMV